MEKQNLFSNKKIIISAIIVAIVAILCAYFAFLLSSYGGGTLIAKGVTVNGVDIGGMDKNAAISQVTSEVEKINENTIDLIMDDNHTVATFSEFSLDYKIEEAVNKAINYGKNSNIIKRIGECFNISRGKAQFETEIAVNAENVSDYVYAYSQTIGSTVVENSYVIEDDKLKLTNGKSGDGIDKNLIASEITDILKTGKSAKIGVNLSRIDPLPYDVNAIYEEICKGPTNARSEEKDGKKYLVAATKGYSFDKADLENLIRKNSENKESYTLDLDVVEPEITKFDETGLFTELLAQYTSSLAGSSYNRTTNVKLAASRVTGTILNPDEIFSYNKTLGDVSAASGYLAATIFTSRGHEPGIGGGICQLSSTLYSAALEANLEIVKRRNHMYIVGYVPYGQDATVYEGELDFRFKNNTNEPLKIVCFVKDGTLFVNLYGKKLNPNLKVEIENIIMNRTGPETVITEDPELPLGEIIVTEKGTIGLTVDTYKKIYIDGKLQSREYLHRSVYKPINRQETHGTKPSDVPVQTEPGDVTDIPVTPETPETPVTPPGYEGI